MKDRYKLIGGSLTGAIAIHVAFVACGHSLAVKGDARRRHGGGAARRAGRPRLGPSRRNDEGRAS